MKTVLKILILFIFAIPCAAQITFQKTIGGTSHIHGTDIQQTSDGGYIVAGQSDLGMSISYVAIIKLNAFGDTVWIRTYLKPGFNSISFVVDQFVQQTYDGGYILTGTDSGTDGGDIYLIKTDSIGDTLWTRSYSGNWDIGGAIRQTIDGGYIITGGSFLVGAGDFDAFLIKTDSSGDTLWTKTYGGLDFDFGRDVQQTMDGGYIVLGTTGSFGAGDYDEYLIKTDSNGDTLWTRTYGWVNYDHGVAVRQTMDGGYAILEGGNSAELIKVNTNGDFLWTKSYFAFMSFSMQETNDSGFVLVGSISTPPYSDAYLIKTDKFGDTLWTKAYGDAYIDNGYDVEKTMDGGYVIVGTSQSFGPCCANIYIIKTDSFGNTACTPNNPEIFPMVTPLCLVSSTTSIVGFTNFSSTNPNVHFGYMDSITTLCNSVGINEKSITISFQISPNTASTSFTINTSLQLPNTKLTIFNLLGEEVYSVDFIEALTVNCESFPPGIYFVSLQSENGRAVQKLVKQ
jgi:hypothetical protein